MPWYVGRHTDPGMHGMVCLPSVVLLAVGVECTLNHLADLTNSAVEGDIFFLEVCMQHMGTHLMAHLTGIIACATVVGHPARGTRRCFSTHFTLLGSKVWTLLLANSTPLHKALACHGVQLSVCLWYLVATGSPGPLTYIEPGKSLRDLPLTYVLH